jgi:hypothetical protein
MSYLMFWSVIDCIYHGDPHKIISPRDVVAILLRVSTCYVVCSVMKLPNNAFLRTYHCR